VVEYRWFLALGDGAVAVWRARLAALVALRGGAALLGAAFVYANLLGVVSSVETVVLPRRVGGLDFAERVPATRLRWTAAAVAPLMGLALAWPLDDWTSVDALAAGRTLGEIEPYTGHDLAFFVYWLPLENALYTWALLTLVATGALVGVLYALTPGLRWAGGRPRVSARVRRHLTVFGGGVLLLLAWGHRLDAYALLSAGSGPGGAFVGADHLGALPARLSLAVITALAAVVVLRAGWANQRRLALWTVTGVVFAALVVRAAAAPVATRLVNPARLAQADAAAAANRTLYTQRAFGVDRVRAVPRGYGLRREAVEGAVSAWDPPALAEAVRAARRVGAEGEPAFQPDPDGRTLRAVLIEAPAPAAAVDDGFSRVVLSVDATGADPATGRPVAANRQPLVDAGRGMRLLVRPGAAGVLVLADEPEVVGDPLGDWRVRLAHALAGRDLRLAFDGTARNRLVSRRGVGERVRTLAPFFAAGEPSGPLMALDSVWYAVPLYDASDSYPLAQRYAINGVDWSEFRAAGTAVVNAHTGTVRMVTAPDAGAAARGWMRRFPGLFPPGATLPAPLAAVLPPAADGALVQAYAFAQFGARGERTPRGRRIPTIGPRGQRAGGDGAARTAAAGHHAGYYAFGLRNAGRRAAAGQRVDAPARVPVRPRGRSRDRARWAGGRHVLAWHGRSRPAVAGSLGCARRPDALRNRGRGHGAGRRRTRARTHPPVRRVREPRVRPAGVPPDGRRRSDAGASRRGAAGCGGRRPRRRSYGRTGTRYRTARRARTRRRPRPVRRRRPALPRTGGVSRVARRAPARRLGGGRPRPRRPGRGARDAGARAGRGRLTGCARRCWPPPRAASLPGCPARGLALPR
jgi:hypothetical protein